MGITETAILIRLQRFHCFKTQRKSRREYEVKSQERNSLYKGQPGQYQHPSQVVCKYYWPLG